MASVTLRGVTKSFGDVEIISGIDLEVSRRRVLRVRRAVGLRQVHVAPLIAGLEDITVGVIAIGGRRREVGVASAERGVAMVFQSYALYPHMTVRENIGFGLRMTGQPEGRRSRRARQAAELLQLERTARPQARRSSRAASGSASPSDAPSCASRACSCSTSRSPTSTRRCACRCASRSAKLHQSLGATMIYVTHDQIEAMTMADRIVVLNGGRDRADRLAAGALPPPAQPFRGGLHRQSEDERCRWRVRRRGRIGNRRLARQWARDGRFAWPGARGRPGPARRPAGACGGCGPGFPPKASLRGSC